MKRIIKYSYLFITILFILLTIYEIFSYFKMDSNYFGIFYLLLNLFIIFLLFITTYNYDVANKNIRVSKNIICIIIGLFSSFLLYSILTSIFSYVDQSSIFINSIFVIIKVIKPIIYFILAGISVLEVKFVK